MKISTLLELKNLQSKRIPWPKNVKIGWWLDNDPVRFYHGTHKRNLENILKNGIYAPKSGPTANWVSLALEPNTAHGYASMSGSGGESEFRKAGSKAMTTPQEDRIVLILDIPQTYFISKMGKQRGNVEEYRNKLIDKQLYLDAKDSSKTDTEYYAITEIRLPDFIPAIFISGFTSKF